MSETRRHLLVRGGRLAAAVAAGPALRFTVDDAEAAVDPRLRALDRAVRGEVITRADPRYASARLPYNARFSGITPLAVVRPRDARDVREVVRWAARTRVPIAARSGGHSYAGYSTTRGVVVDLAGLAGVRVDAHGRAVVGAGARLGRVYAALAQRGRAISAGTCPTVGMAGLALGGGFGLASRAWGLTCDNLVELEVVTADGRVLVCDADRHADLFWACRGGGGGNFGIATRFVFRTQPASSGSFFVATWPWQAVDEVVDRFLGWAPRAPDALTCICRLAAGRPEPTVQVFGQFLGGESDLRGLVAGLTRGLPSARLATGTATWLDLVRRWAGCLGETAEECNRFEPASFVAASDYVARPLTAAGTAALRETIERRGSAPGAVLIDSYGGAVNRVAPSATAFVHRRMLASLQYYASGEPGSGRAWIRTARARMRPHVSGFAYQNYIDPDLRGWLHAYYGGNLRRLVAVKRRYDADNLFRFAQSIPTRL